MINFEHTSPPVIDDDLNEVEQRFCFTFPEELRRHYLRYNGGRPDKNCFIEANRTCVVRDFLPIKKSAIATLGTLETCIQWLKVDQQIIPDHLVPFATDSFGNFYCFSVREEDRGAIYWLKMEGRRKPDGDFLSDSLDHFLGKLKTKEEARLTNRGDATGK